MQGKRMADLFNKVLKMYPPLLHNFFLSTFTDPASWHNARLTFTQTSAVWCMVGHMLGLGDRHGENILMDTSTGACIHIDFACLFDKVLSSSMSHIFESDSIPSCHTSLSCSLGSKEESMVVALTSFPAVGISSADCFSGIRYPLHDPADASAIACMKELVSALHVVYAHLSCFQWLTVLQQRQYLTLNKVLKGP